MQFGERLRAARVAAKKTQEQLADAAGLTHAAISKCENGKTEEMHASNVFAIADFLGVNPRWLSLGEEPMYPDPGELSGLSDDQKTAVRAIIQTMRK